MSRRSFGLSGAHVAQSVVASSTTAISGPLGSATPMRLPRLRPNVASDRTVRSTSCTNAVNVSGGRPGASNASALGSRRAWCAMSAISEAGTCSRLPSRSKVTMTAIPAQPGATR